MTVSGISPVEQKSGFYPDLNIPNRKNIVKYKYHSVWGTTSFSYGSNGFEFDFLIGQGKTSGQRFDDEV